MVNLNKNMDKMKIIESVEKYIILLTVFLYPLLILTNFTNLFEVPKLTLLIVSVSLLIILKTIKLVIKKDFDFNTSKFDSFALLTIIVFTLTSILSITNKVDAFFLPGNASFLILSAIYFLIINQLSRQSKVDIVNTLLASGFILSTLQIFSSFGIFSAVSFLPEVIKINLFTPFGNVLNSIIFLASLSPILIIHIIKKREIYEKILSGLVLTIFLVSMASHIYMIIPNNKTSIKILEPKYGWSIAIDSLKNYPIWGVGPSNFNYAFNRFRPIEFNLEKDSNLKYFHSSSFVLTIITEAGIMGLIFIAYLIYLIAKEGDFNNSIYLSILILALATIFLPLSAMVVFIFFIYLSIYSESKNTKLGYFINKIPQIIIVIPIIILTLSLNYLYIRSLYAEILFSNSVKSLKENNATKAYDQINKAVSTNRYVDRYHSFSAAINLAIAQSLAQKADLKDEDRNKISQLIQQSIREGKASVAANKYKSSNWESLSDVYKSIMPFAKGSDVFAIESLKQSIALDPINTNLRIKLGGLYYTLKNYESAIEIFKLAVLSKPDSANAHYNLALAYKEAKQLEKAKVEINTTLSLLGKESTEYNKALKELQSIEELTKPVEKIEAAIEPQIELPQE